MKSQVALVAILAALFTSTSSGRETIPPITPIENATPKQTVFAVASRTKPLVLQSTKEAARHFSGADLVRLLRAVDFNRQLVLVFAWRGSGRDRQRYAILESFPEQVVFSIQPGRTRDLRPHTKVYALRSNVKWRVNGAGPAAPARPPDKRPSLDEYVKVEVRGKLNGQAAAIGGETTGATVTAKGVVWELDLKRDARLRNRVRLLHGKTVVVSGQLSVKSGVEIRQRFILSVDSIRAGGQASGGAGVSDYLTPRGMFARQLQLRDAQSGFAGQSGRVWTVEPDGSWQRRPFLNRNVRAADAQGKLSQQQIRALAQQLADQDLLGLPARLGKQSVGANPHSVSLAFGDKRSEFVLRAGSPVPPPDSGELDAQSKRFAVLVHELQRLLQPR